jgi:hypothetical protein
MVGGVSQEFNTTLIAYHGWTYLGLTFQKHGIGSAIN